MLWVWLEKAESKKTQGTEESELRNAFSLSIDEQIETIMILEKGLLSRGFLAFEGTELDYIVRKTTALGL